MQMLLLVEKYNIKDMKEALLLRMKSQVVDEKNFMGIVNQVEKLSYSSAVKDVMDRILYNYILDNYGASAEYLDPKRVSAFTSKSYFKYKFILIYK